MQFTLEKVVQTEKEENFGFFQGEICMFLVEKSVYLGNRRQLLIEAAALFSGDILIFVWWKMGWFMIDLDSITMELVLIW